MACLLLFSHNPFFDVPGFVAEIDADLEQLPGVGLERASVMLFLDLPQRFFRRFFHLEFHHVDVLVGLHHEVDPSFRGVILLHLHVEPDETEPDEQHVLVMDFQISG